MYRKIKCRKQNNIQRIKLAQEMKLILNHGSSSFVDIMSNENIVINDKMDSNNNNNEQND